jgi:uncharacterized protein (UPF0548 family)
LFLTRRPATDVIERFLRDSRALPLSYAPGDVAAPARDWNLDEIAAPIGRGEMDFERARRALREWRQFDLGWVRLFPPGPPAETGTNVAVLVRHLGFWSLNGCRVVDVVDEPGRRLAVSYGTLINHAESGEEAFEVSLDTLTATVSYRIRAVSRPRSAAARIGYPVVRRLQARFRTDSVEAMRRAVAARGGS